MPLHAAISDHPPPGFGAGSSRGGPARWPSTTLRARRRRS